MSNNLLITIGIVILCVLSFGWGYSCSSSNNKVSIDEIELSNVERDTVTKIDTIYVDRPIPKYITKTKEVIDTVYTYINNTDTIEIPLQLPIVEKEYENDLYYARIKGVEYASFPSLESIKIYQPNTTITETIKVREKANKPHFGGSLGIGFGYGLMNKKPDVFLGGTIGLTF